MYMKNKLLFTLFLHCFAANVFAQKTIAGKVNDNNNNPISYANVGLYSIQDSSLIAGSTTDSKGIFKIKTKENTDSLFLRISFSGFKTNVLQLINTPSDVDLGTIKLQETATQLSDVVVTAKNSITEIDRRIIFPNKFSVKNSNSGFDFLKRLMLPGIKVDIVNNSISSLGNGNVSVYINEKKSTQAEIMSLRPDEVLKVEFIDNPGVEYANENISAVINITTKKRISGILGGVNTTNAVTTGNGNNFAFVKYNYGKSEISTTYSMEYSAVNNRKIDQTDEYTLTDGSKHTIKREGFDTFLKYTNQKIALTYNFTEPNKYVFETSLRGTFYDSPDRGHKQMISETGKTAYYGFTAPKEKYHSPSIDIFYKMNLPSKNIILANIVGTYTNTNYGYYYQTYRDRNLSDAIDKYGYETQGKKYSIIGELKHYKFFDNSMRLTSGLTYNYGYVDNKYLGKNEAKNKITTNNAYLYTQLDGKLKKLGYSLGLGVSRDLYVQGNEKTDYWTIRPYLTLSISPLKNMSMRYKAFIMPDNPSLSMLSNISQQVNSLEFKVGNPNLKPYNNFVNSFLVSYSYKNVYLENTLSYTYSKNPILSKITRKTDQFNNTIFEVCSENQDMASRINNRFAAQYYIIPNVWGLAAAIDYSSFLSKGFEYSHRHNILSIQMESQLLLKQWEIGLSYNSPSSSLSGENINYYSDYSNLSLGYNFKNIFLGINWSYIFKKECLVNREMTINKYMNKDLSVFVPGFSNMISFKFSWNFNYGRKYNGERKSLNNIDSDSGIFKY